MFPLFLSDTIETTTVPKTGCRFPVWWSFRSTFKCHYSIFR